MAKKVSYSLEQFKVDRYQGVLYNHPKEGWIGASKAQTAWYNQQKGVTISNTKSPKTKSTRGRNIDQIRNRYGKYFPTGTKFTSRQGHTTWSKPLALKGGKNPNYNWGRVSFKESPTSLPSKTSSKNQWGANINKSVSSGATTVLNGSGQWIRQIQISIYSLGVQSENFRVVAGKRALKVFQNSFKYQRFYSNTGRDWPAHSPFTKKMRAMRGTGSRILNEYGRLYKSIKIDPNNSGHIETKPVYISQQWQTGKKSKLTQTTIKKVVFAGFHNEGKGHHGPIPTNYKRRQFMGHSSYLNPLTDSFMRKMMKLYLFDSVFLVKKA